MALGPIGVSSSSASSSISTASQSLSFNPVITLASPESNIRNQPTNEQTNSADSRSTTEAKAETKMPGLFGGGSGETETGLTGLFPSLGLGSTSRTAGSGPSMLAGDLIPRGTPQGGLLSGTSGLLIMGGLAVAAFFLARRFF